jgi:hypothetical protein
VASLLVGAAVAAVSRSVTLTIAAGTTVFLGAAWLI